MDEEAMKDKKPKGGGMVLIIGTGKKSGEKKDSDESSPCE